MRNMLEKIRWILLWVCVIALSGQILAQTTYYVNASKLNIRDSAATSGRVIGSVSKGQDVEVFEVNNGWAAVLTNGDTGYISMKYLSDQNPDSQQVVENNSQVSSNDEPWTDKQKAIFWICFVIAVAIYAIAVFRVQRGEMVVIKGWIDFGLLVFPWLVVFLHISDAMFEHMFFGKYVLIALYIIAGICLIASLVLSVTSNRGNLFNIIFSLIMKLVVIPIMAFGVFYLLYKILNNTGLSRRSIILFAVLGILIGGLMSFDD